MTLSSSFLPHEFYNAFRTDRDQLMENHKINRDAVLRSLRSALRQIQSNSEPRYHDLLKLTVENLVREFPELLPTHGRTEEIIAQAKRYGLDVAFPEGYSYLHTLGYIVHEFNGLAPPNPAGFRVTEAGKQWALHTVDPSPEDEQGYFLALKALVPDRDSVIEQYVQEAVRAYGRRIYFASAVMIGAASEKCLYLLMTALESAVQEPQEKKRVTNAIARRGLPTMFTILRDHLSKAKDSIPWTIYEGVDCHIFSFQEAIRVQRTDAVHPAAGQVSPEQVRLMLASFPAAYKKLHSLTAWFGSNQI